MKKSKIFAAFMSLVMLMSLAVPAFAATNSFTSGGNAETPVRLTTTVPTFSVTVPTVLPINVDAYGTVSTASGVKLVNHSSAAVKVSNMTISGKNGWTIADYDGTDMNAQKVGKMLVAMQINGAKTTGPDAINFAGGTFTKMLGVTADSSVTTNQMPITYYAKVPAQASSISGVNVADVVFTLGWDAA